MTRAQVRRFSADQVIRDIYGTLARDIDLLGCLEVLAPVFKAHMVFARTEDLHHRRSEVTQIGMTPGELQEFLSNYQTRWQGHNLWMQRSVEGYLRQGWQYGEAVVSDKELLASPYYQECLKQADIRHGMGVCLWHDGGSNFALIGFNRSARAGPVDSDEIALVQAIRPHLANAYAIHRQFARVRSTAQSLRKCLDASPIPTMILSGSGMILESNEAASAALQRHRLLKRSLRGEIGSSQPALHTKVVAAIRTLSAGAQGSRPISMLVGSRTSGEEPEILHLCALPDAPGLTTSSSQIVAFLIPGGSGRAETAGLHVLQTVLGLTAAEARVAWLLRRHFEPEQVAAALGVAVSTVRTHLKHVFEKTGVSRQAEVVVLVERVLSGLPRPPATQQLSG